MCVFVFFFKQKTAYEMRISDWSSDVCSSDLIPGVSCVKPQAALYLFVKLDPEVYPLADDEQFALELLREEKLLIVQGTAFNWVKPDHFRFVFLPNQEIGRASCRERVCQYV